MGLSWVDLTIAAWVVVACVTVIFMSRRGHSGARWVVLAFLLGPIALPLAAWGRFRSRFSRPKLLPGHGQASGGVMMLVGVDGSRESMDALRTALALFAEHIGRLTLAHVLTFESASPRSPERQAADAVLREAVATAEELGSSEPVAVILAGDPATALVDHALVNGDELIVVGPHGGGESALLLGNVAAALTRQQRVPALVLTGKELAG